MGELRVMWAFGLAIGMEASKVLTMVFDLVSLLRAVSMGIVRGHR